MMRGKKTGKLERDTGAPSFSKELSLTAGWAYGFIVGQNAIMGGCIKNEGGWLGV
jgi:hypothetical protein